jgi:hypothetical protein
LIHTLKSAVEYNFIRKPAGTGSLQAQAGELIALFNQGRLQEALLQGEALAERFLDVPFIPNLLGGVTGARIIFPWFVRARRFGVCSI